MQAAIDETLISPVSLPERVKPDGANTVDNKDGDITLLNNHERGLEAIAPIEQKNKKGAVLKIFDEIGNGVIKTIKLMNEGDQ